MIVKGEVCTAGRASWLSVHSAYQLGAAAGGVDERGDESDYDEQVQRRGSIIRGGWEHAAETNSPPLSFGCF